MKRGNLRGAYVFLVCLASIGAASSIAAPSAERIIGGDKAVPGRWPYVAYVLAAGKYQCGGTLVSKTMVLTAGHCTLDPYSNTDLPASSYLVRLNSVDAFNAGEVHHIKRVIRHEGFSKHFPLENDIALLELDNATDVRPAPLDGITSSVAAVRLAVEAKTSPFAKILGWGRTNSDPSKGTILSNLLLEAALPIVANDACQTSLSTDLKKFGPIDARRLCAGRSQGGVDACNGDSGGPILAQDSSGNYALIGLVSYGDDYCGKEGSYGVYTRVSAFGEWLGKSLSVDDNHKPVPPPPVIRPSPITSAQTLLSAATSGDGRVKLEILDASLRPQNLFKPDDDLKIRITSKLSGSLILIDIGEDGTLTQLFPNQFSETGYHAGQIRAGTVLTFPDSTWGFAITAALLPANKQERNRIIAVVTQDPALLEGLLKVEKSGLRSASDLARLEVVLRPNSSAGGAGTWAATLEDYIVRRPE